MKFFVDTTDSIGDFVVEASAGGGEEVLGLDDTGDGCRGQAKDAERVGEVVEGGILDRELDQATGEDADEGDLFNEAGDVGEFDTGEVIFRDATGVEAMFEGVGVAGLGASGGVSGGETPLRGAGMGAQKPSHLVLAGETSSRGAGMGAQKPSHQGIAWVERLWCSQKSNCAKYLLKSTKKFRGIKMGIS